MVLVKIIFGRQVLKWWVWGKTGLCGAGGGSFSKVMSKGTAGNERNSVAREGTRAPWGEAEEEVRGVKGLRSTAIIAGNYCLERLEVLKRLQTPEGRSMGQTSWPWAGMRAEPGIPCRLCSPELPGVTVAAAVSTARVFLGS